MEVQTIHPGRVHLTVSVQKRAVKMEDSTYKGVYMYAPDAVNPDCGQVKMEIYSSKGGDPTVKTFDEKTVQHDWADFDAFRTAQTLSTQAGSASKPYSRNYGDVALHFRLTTHADHRVA